jgi:hypothetical protein
VVKYEGAGKGGSGRSSNDPGDVTVPRLDIETLATGWGIGLDLDASGLPATPVILVDLASPTDPSVVLKATRAAGRASALLVGIAPERIDPVLEPLTAELTISLAKQATTPHAVSDPDPDLAGRRIAAAAARNPQAAVVLGHVLRQTERLPVQAGLRAEAAAYSMLLAGPEVRRWITARNGPRAVPEPVRPPVATSLDGGVLKVALDRPERRNSFDARMRAALVAALLPAVVDEDLRVELSGAGPDFSSGGDLDEFGTATDVGVAYFVRLEQNPGWLVHRLGRRVVALVHGACIGAGVELPAFAGRVVATPSSWFALPEIGMGLIPGAGGTVSLTRRIGRWRTAWMALTASRVDAGTALAWGLVDEVADA